MVSVIRRMKMFRGRLAHLRAGPGAYVLPTSVRKLSLEFAFEKADGHWGPRKFWRNYLPALKFYNPDLEVAVKREHKIGGPCVMTIEYADGQKKDVQMQNKEAPQIAAEVFTLLSASKVEVSEEDKQLAEKYVKDKEDLKRREKETEQRKRKRAEQRKLEAAEISSMQAI